MGKKSGILELVGKDLGDFKIVEMTEIYRLDEDGRKCGTVGFFKDPDIAKAFIGTQADQAFHDTGQALVLTNGTVGYVINQQDPVKLFDDEAEVVQIKEKALEKLSDYERKLLGY